MEWRKRRREGRDVGGERLDQCSAILTVDCCCRAGSSRLAQGEEAVGTARSTTADIAVPYLLV